MFQAGYMRRVCKLGICIPNLGPAGFPSFLLLTLPPTAQTQLLALLFCCLVAHHHLERSRACGCQQNLFSRVCAWKFCPWVAA
eukprot:scaffold75741_cov22-Tisochrysis_lutea.AAC.1